MDLVVPALGESITEAVIAKWLKKVGEAAAVDEPVVDLETDKVSVQLPAPAAGVLSEQLFPEGATVRVGQVIGRLEEGKGERPADTPKAKAKPAEAAPPVARPAAERAAGAPAPAPAAKASASEEAQAVLPPSKRKAMRERKAKSAANSNANSGMAVGPEPEPALREKEPGPGPGPGPARVVAGDREEVVPMTPLRRTIATRLVQAQKEAAVLSTFNEIDMSAVLELRARDQEAFTKKHGVKLGLMSLFTKAAVAALADFPGLNAELRGTDIIYKKHYDIGIAIGSGRGLVVPVLRDADQMSFAEIERAIAELAGKAKENRLTLQDLSGATFTITNGGVYGSMLSTPLLNFPQTGILGMHNIVKRAVVVDDAIAIRPMMYVALSYDHRVVDGREAVQCLVGVKERIEQPDRLMFEI